MDSANINELTNKIIDWGREKGILPSAIPYAQFQKTQEEVAELGVAIAEQNIEEIKDAIGDIYVTLVMQSQAWGLSMDDCIESAYNTIAKRQGRMVDGIFVKEEVFEKSKTNTQLTFPDFPAL